MSSPLEDPKNWTKPKKWIVPVELTIFVDDPEEYDVQMAKFVQKVLNELRSICRHMDKSGKQLSIEFLDPIKDPKKFRNALKGVEDKELDDEVEKRLEAKLEALLKKRGLLKQLEVDEF